MSLAALMGLLVEWYGYRAATGDGSNDFLPICCRSAVHLLAVLLYRFPLVSTSHRHLSHRYLCLSGKVLE